MTEQQISCVHLKKRKKLMEHPNIWKNYFIAHLSHILKKENNETS